MSLSIKELFGLYLFVCSCVSLAQQIPVGVSAYVTGEGSTVNAFLITDSVSRKLSYDPSMVPLGATIREWVTQPGSPFGGNGFSGWLTTLCSSDNNTNVQTKLSAPPTRCRASVDQYLKEGVETQKTVMLGKSGLGVLNLLEEESKELASSLRSFNYEPEIPLWNALINTPKENFAIIVTSRSSSTRPKHIFQSTLTDGRKNSLIGMTERDIYCGEVDNASGIAKFGLLIAPRTKRGGQAFIGLTEAEGSEKRDLGDYMRLLQQTVYNISGSGSSLTSYATAFLFSGNNSIAVVPSSSSFKDGKLDSSKLDMLLNNELSVLNLTRETIDSAVVSQIYVPFSVSEQQTLKNGAQAIEKNVKINEISEWAFTLSATLLAIGGILAAPTEKYFMWFFLVIIEAAAGFIVLGFSLGRGVERGGIYVTPLEKYVNSRNTEVLADAAGFTRCVLVESTTLTIVMSFKGNAWQVVTLSLAGIALVVVFVWTLARMSTRRSRDKEPRADDQVEASSTILEKEE